jgi:flavin-binding protein dodecin
MSEHVYESLEITGSSPDGVTQAIDRAVAEAL